MLLKRVFSLRKRRSAYVFQSLPDIRENSVENAVGGAEGVGPVAKHSLSRHSTVVSSKCSASHGVRMICPLVL